MKSIDTEAVFVASNELIERIRPMLSGTDPAVVGAVLGQLSAIFIAGHHPSLRAPEMRLLTGMIHDLVPVEVEEMIAQGRVGADWRGGADV